MPRAIQLFVRNRGENSRTYHLPKSGRTVVFGFDPVKNAYLWEYPQTQKGAPKDQDTANMLAEIKELFGAPPSVPEHMMDSYSKEVNTDDMPNDIGKFGKVLSAMEKVDFDYWMNEHDGETRIMQEAYAGLVSVSASMQKRNAVKKMLEKMDVPVSPSLSTAPPQSAPPPPPPGEPEDTPPPPGEPEDGDDLPPGEPEAEELPEAETRAGG